MPFPTPSYDLAGKVAIVTGGTKGLGYDVIMALAYYGVKVVIISRHQDDCDGVIKEVTELGGEAIDIKTDVQVKGGTDSLVTKVAETYGKLDVMMNNAGMAITKPMPETSEVEYNIVVDSNPKSMSFGSTATTREMIKQSIGGRIINMASIGGLIGTKNISTHGVSKVAVPNLTKGMVIEFSKYDIMVDSVYPGYMKTALNAETLDSPQYQKEMFKKISLRKWGKVEEITVIVLLPASDFSGTMTGSYVVAGMGTTSG